MRFVTAFNNANKGMSEFNEVVQIVGVGQEVQLFDVELLESEHVIYDAV